MKAEREVLQRVVFPRLRKFAAQRHRLFQAIDLRWGVREDAALNQQTMRICLAEIARCQQASPQLNFLVLLGQRYGWRPLPSTIPESEFAAILERVTADEGELIEWRERQANDAKGWYRRDENAVPPVYDLQPREGKFIAPSRWTQEEELVLGILERASVGLSLSEESRLKYGSSATEQEIFEGALGLRDAGEQVVCFLRTLRGSPESAINYFDHDAVAYQRLTNLRERLRQRLPGSLITEDADWNDGHLSSDYLKRFARAVFRRLARVIKADVEKQMARDLLEEEIAVHTRFSSERCHIFVGRVDMLASIQAHTIGNRLTPLAVIGPPGSGKSALLARAALELRAVFPTGCVVERYIGATPTSSNVRSLLASVCAQICRSYAVEESHFFSEYRELAQEFSRCMAMASAEHPLIIVLDALDQLTTAHDGRSLAWLPRALRTHVCFVCSTTPGDCASALEQKLPPFARLQLMPLSLDEGDEALDLWLKKAGRTLQPVQRALVREASGCTVLPLWLKLVFEEVRRWPSYAPASLTRLAQDVPGIIDQLLQRLSDEANHGPVLVAHALGYLAASKRGLAENELLDVLALDSEVMYDVRNNAKHKLAEFAGHTPLPAVLWSRLFFDLEAYLAESAAEGACLMTFYHRQIGETVRRRFLDVAPPGAAAHQRLAEYFQQTSPPTAHSLVELPYQLAYGGRASDLDKLINLLGDVRYLHERCRLCDVYELITDYDLLSSADRDSQELREFLARHAQRLARYQTLLFALVYWEGPFSARKNARRLISSGD